MNSSALRFLFVSFGLVSGTACTTNQYFTGNGGAAGMAGAGVGTPTGNTTTGQGGNNTGTMTGNTAGTTMNTAGTLGSMAGAAGMNAAGTGMGGMGGAGGATAGTGMGGTAGAGGASGNPVEYLTEFDTIVGAVANPDASIDETIMPTLAGGIATFTVPFTAAEQQYGWNIPVDPLRDGTGEELVVRLRLVSGFVSDGGVQLYAFSDEWLESLSNWTNVVVGEWTEFTLDLDTASGAFNKTMINGAGFTLNTGDSAGTPTTAVFEVDFVGFRDKEVTNGGGGAGGGGTGGTGGADAGAEETLAGIGEGSIPAGAGRIFDAFTAVTGEVSGTGAEIAATVGNGLQTFEVETTDATQSASWNFYFPTSGGEDLTGMEIVVRVQRVSGFTDAGGIQLAAFSATDGEVNIFKWNTVAAVGVWQELTLSADEIAAGADGDFSDEVGTVGLQFNTGDEGDDATPAVFVVDWIGIREAE